MEVIDMYMVVVGTRPEDVRIIETLILLEKDYIGNMGGF